MNRNHEIAPGGTLKDLITGETMHSSIGAWEEANSVYVGQSDLDRPGRGIPLVVYDIGMGVAANAIALLDADQSPKLGPTSPIHVVSFENDPSGLALALENLDSFPYLRLWEPRLRELLKRGRIEQERIQWDLHVGDFAAMSLEGFPRADLIYFDFYSPKVCGPLWAVEIFSKLKSACAPGARLITYSSATHARVAMLLAGLFVGRGRSTPAKSETTLAALSMENLGTAPLGGEWLGKLLRSSRAVPFGWEEGQKNEVLERLRRHPQFADCSNS